jgi:hypothetical protein
MHTIREYLAEMGGHHRPHEGPPRYVAAASAIEHRDDDETVEPAASLRRSCIAESLMTARLFQLFFFYLSFFLLTPVAV